MANKADDDYWFSSDTKAFNFEDESFLQKSFKTSLSNYVKPSTSKISSVYIEGNELTDEFQRCDIPIRSVISQQCLDKLLKNDSASDTTKHHTEKIILEAVHRIVLNLPNSLEEFKNLRSKTELLDAAINIADGNAILTVVLFLANTLKKDILYKLLSARRVALLHYINYLSIRLNTKELTNLLMLTGYSTTIGIKLFKITIHNTVSNAGDDSFKKKLELLYNNHFSRITTEKDNQILKSYIELLEWQQNVQKFSNMSGVIGQSVNACLGACCQFYWDKAPEHVCSTQYLSKLQGISERQLHWIFLDMKSANQAWDEIEKMFIKNNWFGTRKLMTCSLSAETVVLLMGERGAPPATLQRFLALVEDTDTALALALRFRCHQHVVAHYLATKDRAKLLSYKSKIPPTSEHYFFLEHALQSLANK